MSLKQILENLDGVEEALKAFYKKGQDGKYYLDMEADPETKKKLDEFRDNNIRLMKEQEELKKKYEGVDPEKYKEFAKKMQDIEDKKLLEAGKVDELVAQKTERMRADYENQITKIKEALDGRDKDLTGLQNRLSEVLIDSELTKALTQIGGVKQGAMEDLIARGRRVWKLEDGKPVPKEGDRILYGKDGKEAMTFVEWAQIQTEVAPYFFEPSNGSGASGNTGTKKIGGVNMAEIPPTERLKLLHKNDVVK
jgi:hypothetical protein